MGTNCASRLTIDPYCKHATQGTREHNCSGLALSLHSQSGTRAADLCVLVILLVTASGKHPGQAFSNIQHLNHRELPGQCSKSSKSRYLKRRRRQARRAFPQVGLTTFAWKFSKLRPCRHHGCHTCKRPVHTRDPGSCVGILGLAPRVLQENGGNKDVVPT